MKGHRISIKFLRAAPVGALFGCTLLAQAPVQAQETPAVAEVGLQEITVTARRVEENLMTVPASVTALSASDLENRNIKDQTDITFFQPSFRFVNQTGGQGPAVVRGNGAVTFRGLVEAGGSGSVFIDGAPTTDGMPPTLDQVERVEVLKGPQSAYFGRSTFAGAINYITKTPSLTKFQGELSTEASSFSSTDSSFGLSFPIVEDVLGLRVTGRHHVKGGEYVNYTAADQLMGGQTTDSMSATVLYKPTDKLTVKAWASWTYLNDGPEGEAGINSDDGFFNFDSPAAATFKGGYIKGPIPNAGKISIANISCVCTMTPFLQQFLTNNANNYKVIFDPSWYQGFGVKINETQADLRVDYEVLPGYQLSALTAYHYRKSEQRFDIDNRAGYDQPNPNYGRLPNTLPYLSFDNQTQGLGSDWSQELRFTSPQDQMVSYTLGASYLYRQSPGSSLIGVNLNGPTNFGGITVNNTKTPAVFGGVHYKFLTDFTLSAEARYQWDKLFTQNIYVGNVLQTGANAVPLQSTFKSFSPRVSLDWRFAPDSTAYALYSRGYKPGGFNTAVKSNTPEQNAYIVSQGGNSNPTFEQERLDNYEVGIKSTFLDNRARIAVSFYYDQWLDGQVPNTISVPANPSLPIGGGNTVHIEAPVTNAGLIDLTGIEFQGDLQATRHLLFNSSFALNHTDVKHYQTCSDCVQILGTTTANGSVPNAPKWTASLGANYTDHLIGDWDWFSRVDYNYTGSMYIDYTNLAWTQAGNLFNVHVGVNNDNLRLTAFVTNLTNNSTSPSVDRITNGFHFFNINQSSIDYTLPDKRSFGITASYRF